MPTRYTRDDIRKNFDALLTARVEASEALRPWRSSQLLHALTTDRWLYEHMPADVLAACRADAAAKHLLTTENMHAVATVICIEHPEWGTDAFTVDTRGYGHHSLGRGAHSKVLFEADFHRYAVTSWLP